jgi:signal transduction histidine kinase
VLAVRDTGPGIAPEHIPHVFEPFYRADKVRGRDDGHLGLGLFLVHSHVLALGGRCQIESQVGKGTSFCIILPATDAEGSDLQVFDNKDLTRGTKGGPVGSAA